MISTNVQNIITAKSAIKAAIEGKGVVVSATDKLSDYPSLINSISAGMEKEDITNYSYLFGRNDGEYRTRFYNFLTPTEMDYMFWENDFWNDIDLSKYFSADKGNLPTKRIPCNHICYSHNTLKSFKFPQGIKSSNNQSMFQSCSDMVSVDFNGLEFSGTMNSIMNGCTSIPTVDMSGCSASDIEVNTQTMFINCQKATSITLPPNLKSTSLYCTFQNCYLLAALNLNGLDTSACNDFRNAFNTTSLESFDGALISVNPSNANYVQNMFCKSTAMRKIWIPKEWKLAPTSANNSPFLSVGGNNANNASLQIYTDAVSESDQISKGQWTTYWNYYSGSAKVPDSQIHWGSTHEEFLNA